MTIEDAIKTLAGFEWKPMINAPKDGTLVRLLFNYPGKLHNQSVKARFMKGRWCGIDGRGFAWKPVKWREVEETQGGNKNG